MKPFFIFVTVFFIIGIYSISAQDIIVLRNGNVIEARVLEISPAEIKYKRFEHLDGPIIVIFLSNVLSIKYENGTIQIFNTEEVIKQENVQAARSRSPGMKPNKLNVGINIEPSGFALYGPSLTLEFTKNHWNNQINLRFPSLGMLYDYDGFAMGFGYGLNYFWYNKVGGFYLGILFDLNFLPTFPKHHPPCVEFILAINTGFRFVLPIGIYFNVGGYLGLWQLDDIETKFAIRPAVTFGYNF